MPLLIIVLFLLFPVLEIAVFIEVGSKFGTWPTVGAIFLTAVVGVSLVRTQGLATLSRARISLQRNEFPLAEAFDGHCLALAGVLLLTPGFVTDSMGGLLLVPPLRAALRRFVLARTTLQGTPRGQRPPGSQRPPPGGHPHQPGGPTIDGQYHVVEEDGEARSDPPKDPRLKG